MMVNHGHQSYFISKGGRRTLFKLTERKKINDVEVIFINKIGFPTFKISQLKKLNKFLNEKAFNNYVIKLIKREKISIIHAHYNLQTCLYFLNLRKEYNLDFKFVMRFAGMLWYEELKKKPELYTSYKYIFENSDLVNFISEGLYQLYERICMENKFEFRINNYFILDIGVKIRGVKEGHSEDKVLKLVMATRFSQYQKRQDLIIKAIELLNNTIPVSLVLIGSGPNKDNIQHLIDITDLKDNVKIVSFIPQNQLWEYLKEFDLLCHACEYEGLSKIILESMEMGLPVLVSDVLPLNNYIEDGVTGFLAKNTPEDWAATINKVYQKRGELQRISNNSRQFIENQYDAKKKYTDVYKRVQRIDKMNNCFCFNHFGNPHFLL
jgi:glycosyltransferase involved in cell wall biosynthesis